MMFVRFLIPFLIIAGLLATIHLIASQPENEIVGTWKEVSWRYDKANKLDSIEQHGFMPEEIKDHISKDMVIHKCEIWEFKKNGNLDLVKQDKKRTSLNWIMKGKGRLLKLKHNDTLCEYYQIAELSEDKLVLFFENAIHTRGIVKVEFERIR